METFCLVGNVIVVLARARDEEAQVVTSCNARMNLLRSRKRKREREYARGEKGDYSLSRQLNEIVFLDRARNFNLTRARAREIEHINSMQRINSVEGEKSLHRKEIPAFKICC